MTQKQRLTTAEAAGLIDPELKPRTLQKWRDAGKGPAYVAYEGRFSHYRRCDIEGWIKRNVTLVDPATGAEMPLPSDAARNTAAGIAVDDTTANEVKRTLENAGVVK